MKSNIHVSRLRNSINKNTIVPTDAHGQSPYEKLLPVIENKHDNINTFTKIPLIYGIYFICCIGHYKKVVAEQLASVFTSGLFQKTEMIYCFICKFNPEIMDILHPFLSKLTIISTPDNLYEKFALHNARSFLPKSIPFYLYYFHTKGVSRNSHIFDSIRYNLDHFILERHSECIFWLQNGYGAVGTSLSLFPLLHFSGNFWWTHSTHFFTLPKDIGDGYYDAEMYICRNPDSTYISLCQSTNTMKKEDYLDLTRDDILRQSTCIPIRNNMCRRLKVTL